MARYMRTDLGRGHTALRPPVVVTPAALPAYDQRTIRVSLATRAVRLPWQIGNPRKPHSILRPPRVVTAVQTQIFFGPQITYWAAVKSRQSSKGQRRDAKYFLRPPVVLAAAQIFFGPKVVLNVMLPEQRRNRVSKRSPDYELKPPVVIGAGIAWYGPGIYLTRSYSRPGVARLRSPVVVTALVVEVFYGPDVHLALGRRAKTASVLHPPIIPPLAEPIRVTLTPSRRGTAKSRLQPPAVVTQVVTEAFYGPQIWLTYSRRGKTLPGLGRVIVVAEGPHGGVMQSLAPSARGRAKSFLRPPLAAPAAVQVFYGPTVHLTRIRPRRVQSKLRPPTDTIGLEDQGRVRIELAPSSRGRPLSRLRPPTVVFPFFPRSLPVALAPQARGIPKSKLAPPQVVFLAVEIYGPLVVLTRIKPPPTLSILRKPTVVAPVVSYGPVQWLTYSRRGRAKPKLRPPALVAAAPAYAQVLPPALAYSRRGRPIYKLRPPTRVFPFIARPTVISLAPQSRGAPLSFLKPPTRLKTNVPLQVNLTYSRRGTPFYALKPPTVVRLAAEIYGPEQWLTYSRRPKTRSKLLPPAVVGRQPFRGPLLSLAPSRYVTPKSFLSPPAVTGRAPFRGLLTHLTYSRRGRTLSFRQPERVGAVGSLGPEVHLTRIKHPPVLSLLKPPTVVGAGIAFYGPLTTLVRIRPPRVHYVLRVTLVAFRRPHGDVCGFDIAGSFVCSLEVPGSQVSGAISTRFGISGSSRAGSTVSGSEEQGGSVSGSDRKAT